MEVPQKNKFNVCYQDEFVCSKNVDRTKFFLSPENSNGKKFYFFVI